MKTRKVTRWIKVGKPVGGLAWSPDGPWLLLTSYASNPDAPNGAEQPPRTGYYIVDSAAEPGVFHALPGSPDNGQ